MSKSVDITGRKFHRLTVLHLTDIRIRKYKVWKCRCDCGTEVHARGADLLAGHPKSCGCLKSEQQRERARKRPYESLFNSLIQNSVDKGNTLTYEQFLEFIAEGVCHYCGDEVVWEPHRGKPDSEKYNLDRKDSSKGYTKDNCVVCCWPCNRMKYVHGYEEFLDRIRRIATWRANG